MSKLPRREAVPYSLTLRSMTNDQLFETWGHEYDARKMAHVELILAEMNRRKLNEPQQTDGVITL